MTKIPLDQKHPLSPSWRELRLLDLQTELERSGEERGDIAYTSPLWARFSLPHRDPGAAPRWEAKNGGVSLVVRPGEKRTPDGSWTSAGYPFGVIPRLALTYMATEAVRTREPVIHLGDSQREFMSRLGLVHGSTDRRRIRTQIEALSACNIQLSEHASTGGGWGYRFQNLPITKGLQLWLNDREGATPLWGSTVVLSEEFFDSILSAAMPVYLDDLRALGGSSLRHDIYVWLTYRLNSLEKQTQVTWEQLHAQFGTSFTRQRKFKESFLDALRDVLKVYDTARVRVTEGTLVLMPSPRHVRPRRAVTE